MLYVVDAALHAGTRPLIAPGVRGQTNTLKSQKDGPKVVIKLNKPDIEGVPYPNKVIVCVPVLVKTPEP